MSELYKVRNKGCPRPSRAASVAMIPCSPLATLRFAKVNGINRIELAKIGGMTPDVFSFKGKCVASAPCMRAPRCRFG